MLGAALEPAGAAIVLAISDHELADRADLRLDLGDPAGIAAQLTAL
jgi:hypothetical protein